MSWRKKATLAAMAVLALSFTASRSSAALLSWTIDSTKSKLSIAIADTPINLDGTSLTIRIRNQTTGTNGNNVWNIGNTAAIEGTLATDYTEGGAIEFLNNAIGAATGVNSGNYRPNAAAFNSANTNAENPDGQFQNNSQGPAVFAARARASLGLTLDAGYLAFQDVSYDVVSGSLGLGGDPNTTQTFDSSALDLGILQATIALDGLSIIIIGQPIPDGFTSLTNALATNTAAGGTIVNLGGDDRQLTIPVLLPLAYDLGDGIILTLNVTGQIVATATIPEPSTFMMAGVGLVSLGICARRRFRRR